MKQNYGKRKRITACAVLLCLLTLLLCSCTKTNKTEEPAVSATPGEAEPVNSPTPTFGFRDPSVENVNGYAETGIPQIDGENANLWNLSQAYWVENCVQGDANSVQAMFRVLWDEDCLYLRVHILDKTPDTEAESVYDRDSVFFFINEDAKKNKVYSVGDAFYAVDRDGLGYLGSGATGTGFVCKAYEDPATPGYYVEARIPLMTVTGRFDRQIGFDIRINNAEEGKTEHILQWADSDCHTDATLQGVGILTMD